MKEGFEVSIDRNFKSLKIELFCIDTIDKEMVILI